MQRRTFLTGLAAGLGVPVLRSQPATAPTASSSAGSGYAETVRGRVPVADLGRVLPHEHVLVDFIGADQVAPSRYNANEVFARALPHLQRAVELGFRTLCECTPQFLARDPKLLARLSTASGLHLLTNTGLYGARQNKFLPAYAHRETAAQLAARWTAEARDGIEDTGIRPGFIKCGVDADPVLSPVHAKLVRAGALTHAATGLVLAVHTGRGAGLEQLAILREEGVAPTAFIWVHAQGARDDDLFAAADQGAWISLDGLNPTSVPRHLHLCRALRQRGHVERILLSHDAGWFDPAKPDGGTFRGYDLLGPTFLPLLRENGFTAAEVEQLVVGNPAQAFAVSRRLL